MIRFRSEKQITIEEFKASFEIKLQKNNRWVLMAAQLPWDELSVIYYKTLSPTKGAGAKDARLVIGALIIKHMLGLDDRETIETIRENMYIQYFLGLCEYTHEDVFDRSLFTTLRYRLGEAQFDAMTCELIKLADLHRPKRKHSKSKDSSPDGSSMKDNPENTSERSDQVLPNQGKLLLDATVADQMVVYPTDLGLIARSRQESERLIDILCTALQVDTKPRT
jgi:hypothetical protein